MIRLEDEISKRREALESQNVPSGADEVWGLALSGGGIRSATFCFGLLRALANRKSLLRFDLVSSVSGGGYIAATIGSLFNRAKTADEVREIERTIGESNSNWFLWWLRANGRYLIPRGARDRTYVFALYLRNLVAIHFELGIIAMMLGLVLALIDLVGWGTVDLLAYSHPSYALFASLRWISGMLPVVWLTLALVALLGASCSIAYWQVPWVAKKAHHWRVWVCVIAGNAGLVVAYVYFGGKSDSLGSELRSVVWCLTVGLITVWIFALPIAERYLGTVANFTDPRLRITAAQNLLTRALAQCFRAAALIVLAGLVDRIAWAFAFEWDGLGKTGVALAVLTALARALLSQIPNVVSSARGMRRTMFAGHLLGYALTFALCCFWVSLVDKAVLGVLYSAVQYSFADAFLVLLLIAVPVLVYVLATQNNFQFLNLSSLHSFYKGRLTRSYLGAANAARFHLKSPLDVLNDVPRTLPVHSAISSVIQVREEEDCALDRYRPQRHGGPIHLINVCVNQTNDPRGHLFNQDRKGVPLTVASGGSMQVAQRGWQALTGIASLTLGTWTAISGAAVAPGLGSLTRGGIAALATLSGLRLGYWWSETERNDSRQSEAEAPLPKAHGTRWLAKSRGILNETFGVFKGADAPDWLLTDGGHFENTGAYPLLAERAKVIVVADCGADPRYAFGDLENLVRKARIDLQAEIYFQRLKPANGGTPGEPGDRGRVSRPPEAPRPRELQAFGSLSEIASPSSNARVALARIEYRGARSGNGILIVVKPNLCEGLPVDLVNFKSENPDFPQQTTADQFFSEAQWESYFMLGQFMGSALSRDFIQRLVDCASVWFEDDDCSPLDIGLREQEQTAAGVPSQSRLPSRITATAVGATLSLGTAATIGAATWQAIDSARVAYGNRTTAQRAALKELTELWEKLPPVPATGQLPPSAAATYGNLAAFLVRTADTLCPASDAEWFNESTLARHIALDAIDGCARIDTDKRTIPCKMLLEARNTNLHTSLPHCLAFFPQNTSGRANPHYWLYDYTSSARFNSMHPCDPSRGLLARDELEHLRNFRSLSERQALPPASYDTEFLNGSLQTYVTNNRMSARARGSSEDAANDDAKASRTCQFPKTELYPETPLVSPLSNDLFAAAMDSWRDPSRNVITASAAGASSPTGASSTQADKDVCKDITVWVQIYGADQREQARKDSKTWLEKLGAVPLGSQDVVAQAQRNGTNPPLRVNTTTVRYHDADSVSCARALGPALGQGGWLIEPLSPKLPHRAKTVEVWFKPPDESVQ